MYMEQRPWDSRGAIGVVADAVMYRRPSTAHVTTVLTNNKDSRMKQTKICKLGRYTWLRRRGRQVCQCYAFPVSTGEEEKLQAVAAVAGELFFLVSLPLIYSHSHGAVSGALPKRCGSHLTHWNLRPGKTAHVRRGLRAWCDTARHADAWFYVCGYLCNWFGWGGYEG